MLMSGENFVWKALLEIYLLKKKIENLMNTYFPHFMFN